MINFSIKWHGQNGVFLPEERRNGHLHAGTGRRATLRAHDATHEHPACDTTSERARVRPRRDVRGKELLLRALQVALT